MTHHSNCSFVLLLQLPSRMDQDFEEWRKRQRKVEADCVATFNACRKVEKELEDMVAHFIKESHRLTEENLLLLKKLAEYEKNQQEKSEIREGVS